MLNKRIAAVLFVLLFTLGVVLAGNLFYAGEGKLSREANTEESDKRTGVEENDTASLNMKDLFIKLQAKYRWNLNFYGRKAMMSAGDEIKGICARLETAGEEKEDVELNTPWAEAYYEFLEKELKDNSSKMKPTGFRLAYIDDDDVPELLIMEDDFHGAGVRVCTYYHDEVVEIGEFGSMGNMFYAERQGKINGGFTNFGESFCDYYVLDRGKAEMIGTFHAYPDLNYDDDSVTLYEIDGEPVTKKQYHEKLDEFERDNYESIGYNDAVFVDDMARLKAVLAQEIEALELKSSLMSRQVGAMEAYEAFLEEYAEDFLKKDNSVWEDYEEYEDGYRGAKFTLIYLDDDEIPELVISEGWSLAHSPSVYTYADKEVVCIGSFGQYGEIGYVEKEGILLSEYYRHSHGHYAVHQVEGTEKGKLLCNELLRIDEYRHWDSEEKPREGEGYFTYTVDEKDATEEEYMAEYHIYEEYKEKEKKVLYSDCFLMLDGNVRGNLNQAMANLVFEENPFFYPRRNTLLSADIKYEKSETWDTISGELKVKWLKRYDNGDLYKLSVEGITDGALGPERINIYLYVTPDKIYRLWSYYREENGQPITFYNNDSLLMETFDTDEKLIENGELVCCMERVEYEPGKEDQGENEMGTPISEIGKHFSIIPKGEKITYSRVDVKPNGEPDFYETFVWERGKGLVAYKSGFRAEAEILYIENISIKD